MAKIVSQDNANKKLLCRDLYVKNLSLALIEQVTGVKSDVIKRWAEAELWENLKRANEITPSKIQSIILRCTEDISQGQTPTISPDQLLKLVYAYTKISDGKHHLGYTIDAFATLRNFILAKAQSSKSNLKKQQYLSLLQSLTPITDELIHEKFKQIDQSTT